MTKSNYSLEEKRQFAKEMREKPTAAEEHLWQRINGRKLGYIFQRQALVWGFIVDFYCPKLRLAIEVDGSVHELDNQAERDDTKDRALLDQGVGLLRFFNDEVFSSLPTVLANIRRECRYRETHLKALSSSSVLNTGFSKNSSSSRRPANVENAAAATNQKKLPRHSFPNNSVDSAQGQRITPQQMAEIRGQVKQLSRQRSMDFGVTPQTAAERIAEQRIRLAEYLAAKGKKLA